MDPLDLALWQFFVLSTPEIDRFRGNQKNVLISRISKCCSAVGFAHLFSEIDPAIIDELPHAVRSPPSSKKIYMANVSLSCLPVAPFTWVGQVGHDRRGEGPGRRFILFNATC